MIFHVYNEDKSVKKGTLWMHNIDSTAPSCLIIGAFDHLSGNVHTSVGCGGGLWRLWRVVEGCGGETSKLCFHTNFQLTSVD